MRLGIDLYTLLCAIHTVNPLDLDLDSRWNSTIRETLAKQAKQRAAQLRYQPVLNQEGKTVGRIPRDKLAPCNTRTVTSPTHHAQVCTRTDHDRSHTRVVIEELTQAI